MKVYISGPMTGLKDNNLPAFNRAAKDLREAGYEVINPADVVLGEGATWLDYMREALRGLACADGVALLDDWHHSRGACLEGHIAHGLFLPVRHLNVWLASTPEGVLQ